MTVNSESGHIRNVTNYSSLHSACISLGKGYNPANPALQTDGLVQHLTTAKATTQAVAEAEGEFKRLMSERKVAFAGFDQIVRRVDSALRSSTSSSEVDEKAKSLVRLLLGIRATPKADRSSSQAKDGEAAVRTRSSSRLGFDVRVENLDRLISLLAGVPAYNPNEKELKIETLKAYSADLKAKNDRVIKAEHALTNARTARNNAFYKPGTGLIDVAADVKLYIKSAFGPSSPEYKQVSKLVFRKY